MRRINSISRKSLIGCMSLLSLVVLMGCTHETIEPAPVPVAETPISFSSTLQKEEAVTRANLEDYATSFKVWAYKNGNVAVMPGYTVKWIANTANTTTSNSNDWEYVRQEPSGSDEQSIKYWDMDASAYRFFGYALGNGTSPAAVTESTAASPVTFSAAVDATSDATMANAPYFSRLWYSTGNITYFPDKQFGQPVQLEFLKPFCRVRFIYTFTEDVVSRTDITAQSFKPTADDDSHKLIAIKGTATMSYPLDGTSETMTISGSSTANDSGDCIDAFTEDYYECSDDTDPAYAGREHWYTVLPAQNQGSYTLSITIFSEDKTAVVPAEYMQWKPGYQYTYKFKISEKGGITLDIIQVGIDDWVIKNTNDHTVYNW